MTKNKQQFSTGSVLTWRTDKGFGFIDPEDGVLNQKDVEIISEKLGDTDKKAGLYFHINEYREPVAHEGKVELQEVSKTEKREIQRRVYRNMEVMFLVQRTEDNIYTSVWTFKAQYNKEEQKCSSDLYRVNATVKKTSMKANNVKKEFVPEEITNVFDVWQGQLYDVNHAASAVRNFMVEYKKVDTSVEFKFFRFDELEMDYKECENIFAIAKREKEEEEKRIQEEQELFEQLERERKEEGKVLEEKEKATPKISRRSFETNEEASEEENEEVNESHKLSEEDRALLEQLES